MDASQVKQMVNLKKLKERKLDNFKNDRSVKIADLLHQFYRVAEFQRDYVWDDEDVKALIDDIAEAYTEGQPNYFIGAIVLTETEDVFLIVDGQQRITTLTILIAALRDLLKGKNESVYHYLTQFLTDKRMIKGDVADCPRLVFGDKDSDTAIGYLSSSTEALFLADFERETSSNIKANFVWALDYLATIGIEPNMFVNFVLQNVVLIPYITNNIKQALTVFETLNTQGKRLTPIDLLKNALFDAEDEQNWDELKLAWIRFKDTLDKIGETERRFLKYYILVNFNQKESENDVFDWLVKKGNTNIETSPFKFLDHVSSFAESYGYIMQSKGPDGIANKQIQNIRALAEKGRQFFPLLISLRKLNQSSQNYQKLLNAIESVVFSYSVMRAYTGAIENLFSEWTSKLNTSTSENELTNFIIKTVEPEVRRLGRQAFDKLLVANERDIPKKKLQYMLLRIDAYLNEVAGSSLRSVTEYEKYEIEHIVPKKFVLGNPISDNEEEFNNLVGRLGNLTILEKPLNRAVKNGDLNMKKATYENSSFYLCKASVASPSGQNTMAKAFSKIHKIEKMDLYEIMERQKNLAKIISEIYGWEA